MPIQGQPLILRTVNHLLAHGIRTFVILAGENEQPIRDVLGHGDYMGAKIHYVEETEPLGTGGALKAAEHYLATSAFLVFHADILTDINVADLVKFHFGQKKLATIAAKPRPSNPGYGKVMLEGSQITEFTTDSQDHDISIVNTGVYLFESEILEYIEEGAAVNLETAVFPELASQGQLSAFLFQGIWFDISHPRNYELAQLRWKKRGG